MHTLILQTQALNINYSVILPEVIVAVTGIIVMLYGAFRKGAQVELMIINLLGLAGAAVATAMLWNNVPLSAFSGMIVIDQMGVAFIFIFLIVAALTSIGSLYFISSENLSAEEYYALIMFATVGMMLMSTGGDLVMIFLGLETSSIATYVLAGYRRTDLRSNESALKYFVLGSFSTAFLLYGMAMLYGATGSTNLDLIRGAIKGNLNVATGQAVTPELLFVGAGLMLVGFGFKIATTPFHVWTPDVYQGAPTPVTAFMAAGPKAAGFAAFLRVFVFTFSANYTQELHATWINALQVLVILTIIFGNVIALSQTNIKRLLAYSSIAHAGYALIGFLADDWSAVAFYMLTYSVMNIGAFTVVSYLAGKGDEHTELDDFAGVGFRSLGLSIALLIFMLSMAGIPLTAGFVGKFIVFSVAWKKGFHGVVIVAVINSAISVFYYLRPMVSMFFRDSDGGHGHDHGSSHESSHEKSLAPMPLLPRSLFITILLALLGVFYLGILPGRVLDLLQSAAQSSIALK